MRIFSRTPGLLTSALLLLATATGAYISLSEPERPKIGSVPGMSYATAPALKSCDDPRLARLDGESALDFATKINETLFEAFYHCDTNDVILALSLSAIIFFFCKALVRHFRKAQRPA